MSSLPPPPISECVMSNIIDEPPVEPARGYFSQLCVLYTGIASGMVDPIPTEVVQTPNYHMGMRDGYHVVVAHLDPRVLVDDPS